VLHVLPKALDVPEFGVRPEEIAPELHADVETAKGRAAGGAHLEVREEIRWGDTAIDEIVGVLAEEAADLVVIATHGHGVLKRFLIGSVASGVARRSPCPVLLVPPSMWE
jgi:nucleotide-binding universal stress UspA family protein